MRKVPGYKPPNKAELAKRRAEFAFTKTDDGLHKRLHELNDSIKLLKIEQRAVLRAIKDKNSLKKKGALQTVKLYALELSDGCWYIGISFNPSKRFVRHTNGKGASWTKLHRPIRIAEIRPTEFFDQDEVAALENDMTFEYALKYGSSYVRGGGFCQSKPRWPELITQNESIFTNY